MTETQLDWFKFSLSFQVVFYLMSLINPYLSASINIPSFELSFGALKELLTLISGRIIFTNIGFINTYIIPILMVVNILMAISLVVDSISIV